MKYFEIILIAENLYSSEYDFREVLAIIPAESRESVERLLGLKHHSKAPPEFAAKAPLQIEEHDGKEYRWYGEPIIFLLEQPLIENRQELDIVLSKLERRRRGD